MDLLTALENRSIYIIREAGRRFRRLAVCWSIGKDATTLLWLCRKAFFGRIPFPVIHIDTGYKFPEIYRFRDRYIQEWGLDLLIARNEDALAEGMGPALGNKLECCSALKTAALKSVVRERAFEALLLGIRRDEHGIRAKERYFSPRDEQFQWNYGDQPLELWDQFGSLRQADTHVRVHPLLHWTELDVWRYVEREGMPVVELYFGRNGKRYRSIGCHPCCQPVESTAGTIPEIVRELETSRVSERSGRAQDKEDAYAMQKLRSLGYM